MKLGRLTVLLRKQKKLTSKYIMRKIQQISRFFTTKSTVNPQICVVGAGPAGFYATQHLIKHLPNAKIDLYDRLPVPFGLVRFGVAPDHPEVKNVINTFTKTAEIQNVRFLGNVNFGNDISLKELREAYHVVLLSYGADEDRKLNIPGENLSNVLSARRFVGWYNGVPWDKDVKFDLSKESVTIIGQGNVAIDVARILLSPIDKLKTTDITQHALEYLSNSKIRKVNLVGRRGPLQAAFTIKELREVTKLDNCKILWDKNDFKDINQDVISKLPRPRKRITELMLQSQNDTKSGDKTLNMMFYRSPVEFTGGDCIENVTFAVNVLKNERVEQTAEKVKLNCDLAIKSIGYKSISHDNETPFDNDRGIIINDNFKVMPGLYSSGWLATGPTGVILTTMNNAFVTADRIVKDLQSEDLLNVNKPGFDGIKQLLAERNVQPVTWDAWKKIDAYEKESGKLNNKPREKILDIAKMLEIAL